MFHQFIQKTFVLFFIGLIVLGFHKNAGAQVCQPADSGLVSWYRAEGDAADARNLNDGSLQNGTTFAAGRAGQAFKFDGVDDFVEIPDSASLKPQNLTVEAWVRFDNLTGATSGSAPAGFQYIINKKNLRALMFEAFALVKLPDNRLAFTISTSAGPHTTVADSRIVQVGRFYHLVGSYDGTTMRFFVNGRKVGQTAHGYPVEYDSRPVYIGSSGETSWDGKMNGLIDEVRIYNRALTEAEASGNYTTGLSLIQNCDAEADRNASGDGSTDTDVSGWENEAGEFTIVRYGATATFPSADSPGPMNRGAFFFAGGRSALSRASQVVNLADSAARIDAGIQSYNLSAYLGGFSNQGDNARVAVNFLNSTNNIIGEASIGPVTPADRGNVTGLLPRSTSGLIPAGTRAVEITLLMTRADGTYNDAYADNVSFSLIRAAEVPANLAAWNGGDGDARDFTGVNNGALVNNPGFVVGKVGQAFRFQNGSHVEINSNGIFRGQTEGTIEAWIRPRGFAVGTYRNSAIWVESEASRNFTRFGLFYSDTGLLGVYSNNSTVNAVSPAPLALNEWAHVAGTYRAGEGVKLYVNGVLAAASSNSGGALTNDLGAFIGIGALVTAAGDDFRFNGDIDEASVYTRALSQSEIQSIYNAGTAGKELRAATGTGMNVSNALRDATVTFTEVTTAGETSQTPLDSSILPALPYGFMHTGLAYDISTTAVFAGDVNLCFNLPAIAAANFSRLRVLHLENGVWVNRTTGVSSPQLCGRASSLSPFVIAENLTPTAASVAVGGRVTAGGRGVSGAQIAMTDQAGATRYAMTNQFGYYRFDRVSAGATYVLTAHGKNYVFEPRTQVLLVNEELTNVDFTAQPNQESLYRGAAAAR
jgi:hypothetical protein